MAMETQTNLATTTLNGGINDSTNTVVVTTGSVFPATGNFRILIDAEIMLVTARSTNTLTATRAQEGTVAASHSDLTVVTGPLTAGSINQMLADLSQSGIIASVPAATKNGLIYLASDADIFTRDNSVTLDYYAPLKQFTPPVLGDFTWLSQGSSTTDTTLGGIKVAIPADPGTGVNLRVLHKSKTAPYKVTGYFILNQSSQSYQSCGMGFYDPTGGRLVSMHFIVFDADFSYVEVCRWANTTTFTSAPAFSLLNGAGIAIGYMQIENDNTNLIFRISNNGIDWVTVYSEGKTAYLTTAPTKAMFYGRNNTGSRDAHAFSLLSWKEE